jgi:hypothetical protein
MEELKTLKNEGHVLLENYIKLDYSHRTEQQKIDYAYTKLSIKTGRNPHFSTMDTHVEVKNAISNLKKMIERRIKRRKHYGIDKVKFAPNLRELQRNTKKHA